MKVLVVEDDRKVAGFIARGLREDGYAVDVSHDGDEGALHAVVNDYDAIILDVMLPGRSGTEILRELRTRGFDVPILLLTARDATEDVVRGLDLGADDYMTKPFGFEELLARLRALIRRGGATRLESLAYADIALDRRTHSASRAGRSLDLTPKEFQLLEHFLLHAEAVVRRTELLEKVWDLTFDPESNVVDVHVANLRRKLRAEDAAPLIHTIRGVGYMLAEKPPR